MADLGFVTVPVLRNHSAALDDVLGKLEIKQEIALEIANLLAKGFELRLVGGVTMGDPLRPTLCSVSIVPVPAASKAT